MQRSRDYRLDLGYPFANKAFSWERKNILGTKEIDNL